MRDEKDEYQFSQQSQLDAEWACLQRHLPPVPRQRASSYTPHEGVNRFQWPSETTETSPSITLMAI